MRQPALSINIRLFSSVILIGIIALTVLPASAELTWSEETPLTTDPAADWQPAILQASNWKLWVVWHSYRIGNVELFYKTSSDGGLSWSSDTRLTNNPNTDGTPAIMQSQNGTIWVFWGSDRTVDYELYYKTTSDEGVTWSSERRFTVDPNKDITPAACQTADGKIWVLWTTRRNGNDDVYYKTSSNGGTSWTMDAPLVNDLSEDRYPSIAQAKDGKVWVTWTTNRDGTSNFEVYYKTSSDNGQSWSAETRLTSDSGLDMFPSVTQAKDSSIWILWDSDRNKVGSEPQTELYYKVNNGVSWSAETRFTTSDWADQMAEIVQGKTDLFVVWVSDRIGDYNIFFKHAFYPVHDVATKEVKPYLDRVYTGNPLKINVTVVNEGTYSESFSVSVYRDATPIGTQIANQMMPDEVRTLTFTWDTTVIPVGYHYTISATAATVTGELDTADNSLTDGTVHVRLIGDLSGEDYPQVVNIYDAILLSVNFGRPAKDYPDGDVNVDGSINVLDAILVTIHWGETAP